MKTVPGMLTYRNAITHHARYADLPGIAVLCAGGYLFLAEGTEGAMVVAYNDPALALAGRVDMAPEPEEMPLWQQIADPGYYEGTDRRGTLVAGHNHRGGRR